MSSDKEPGNIFTWEEAKEALAKAKQSNFIEYSSFYNYIDHIKRALTENCSITMIIYLDKIVEIHKTVMRAKASAEKDRDKLYHRIQQISIDETFRQIDLQEQRRREMFEKYCLSSLANSSISPIQDWDWKYVNEHVELLILKADKFARGEE